MTPTPQSAGGGRTSRTGRLRRWAGRLTAEVAPADKPLEEAVALADLVLRRRCDAEGRITACRSLSSAEGPSFEADVTDGSSQVTLVWTGRQVVQVAQVGCRIRFQGRLTSSDGHRVVFNPAYTIYADRLGSAPPNAEQPNADQPNADQPSMVPTAP